MKINTLSLKKDENGVWLTADTSIGLIHDYFKTTEEAKAFALAFYGWNLSISKPFAPVQNLLPPKKEVPVTDWASVQKYGATYLSCACPDYTQRGGSYEAPAGGRGCKHMVHVQKAGSLVETPVAPVNDPFACFA